MQNLHVCYEFFFSLNLMGYRFICWTNKEVNIQIEKLTKQSKYKNKSSILKVLDFTYVPYFWLSIFPFKFGNS